MDCLLFCAVVVCALFGITICANEPNILFIVADDLGWNDVGFHGSNQIPTPNIDALAYNGIILNSHYVQSICTPSRSALMTGKYPMRIGMQGSPIVAAEPRALPPGKIMPEYFKDLGYETYLIGKWHLGMSRWNETPTFRGFDHHLGPFNGLVSYYDFLYTNNYGGKDYTGFDMRLDTEPAWDYAGNYATDVYTDYAVGQIQQHDTSKPLFMVMTHTAPHAGNSGKFLEAPQETINKFKYVTDANRRTYAAMVSKVDDSIGAVVEALDAKGMLSNSIIVFLSDNGAPTIGTYPNWGSNYPLRGLKDTLFEGGVRDVAFIWSPLIVYSGKVSYNLFHITDWLPTLFSAAGGDTNLLGDIDGVDQWTSLQFDSSSERRDILLNMDERTKNAALRASNWKLIVGTTNNGMYNGYFGSTGKENSEDVPYNITAITESSAGRAVSKFSGISPGDAEHYQQMRADATVRCLPPNAKKNFCDPATGAICLYDISKDPCEENDLAKFFPSIVRRMKRALIEYRQQLKPQLNRMPEIEKDDPKYFHYTWNPWIDCKNAYCSAYE